MKPPICAVCRKRFDPGRSSGFGEAGLVRFADYRPLPDGMTGHPAGTAWFCRRHYRAAKALQDLSLSAALGRLRRSHWRAALGWLGMAFLVLLAAVAAWNMAGPIELAGVADAYAGRVVVGSLRGMEIGPEGAQLVRRWVESRTRPTPNPLRVVWQQLKYNAWTRGYDLVLWLEPASDDLAGRRFAIYQSGRTAFLRIEFEGRNRVLDASFTAEELERELEPYILGVAEGVSRAAGTRAASAP